MRHASCWLFAALFFVAAAGCGRGPSAPELSNSPVYRNAAEGFRFLVPDDWIQTASSNLPPGDLEGEIFLVRYSLSTPEAGATLMVVCMSESESIDLQGRHAEATFNVATWDVVDRQRTVTMNGSPAERIVYRGVMGGREMTKHVTCFRRNGRVYSFIGLYWSSDEMARQQIERALESVIWEK
jgi:hypothetical protein